MYLLRIMLYLRITTSVPSFRPWDPRDTRRPSSRRSRWASALTAASRRPRRREGPRLRLLPRRRRRHRLTRRVRRRLTRRAHPA
jgi:hypothetical protein